MAGKKPVKKASKKPAKKKSAAKKKAAAKKAAPKKSAVLTRKGFILKEVEKAGKKGVSLDALSDRLEKKFSYEKGQSAKPRVRNSLRQAVKEGLVEVKDGVAIWV